MNGIFTSFDGKSLDETEIDDWSRCRVSGGAHLRRLGGHLDAGLQDRDGEVRVGTAAEPEPEVLVRLLHLQLLHQLVQLRHPAERQVAVGEEHPVTLETDAQSE